MEDAVHIAPLVDAIKQCASDIADTLGHNPYHRRSGHIVDKGFESHEHTQSHPDKTNSLDIAVLLQPNKTRDGTGDGTGPDKNK